MASYTTEVLWERGDQVFVDRRYRRRHELRFDGGGVVAGSSSPHVVPLPYSDPAAVDPEELFVASLASCHMLWFLGIAARENYRVDCYRDTATGVMTKNPAGKLYMAIVTLRPDASFSGDRRPARITLEAMHHEAHAECFIANSVRTDVRCEPVWPAD